MTESFRRHHASGCANQTKVRRIPLLHSRATSKVSTPPLCMRATTASLRDTDALSGSTAPQEGSNWHPTLASSQMAILPPRRKAAITLASSRAAILPPHRRAASLHLSGCYSGRSLSGGLFLAAILLAAILLAALFLAEYLRLDLKIKGVG